MINKKTFRTALLAGVSSLLVPVTALSQTTGDPGSNGVNATTGAAGLGGAGGAAGDASTTSGSGGSGGANGAGATGGGPEGGTSGGAAGGGGGSDSGGGGGASTSPTVFGGGGGGGGGRGATVTTTLENDSSIRGGDGGDGGNGDFDSTSSYFGGGGGGGGGSGIFLDGGTVINRGTVEGGNGGGGGLGGGSGYSANLDDGLGGRGGHGISVPNGGRIENFGTISGGDGGYQANNTGRTRATGGHGVTGSDLTLVNAGAIVAGNAADAVLFVSGTNVLELRHGYSFAGNVQANGTDDALRFGGAADASFALGEIGAGQLFRGFERVEKSGSGTWTLTGTGTFNGASAVNEGRLVVDGTMPSTVTLTGTGILGGTGSVGGLVAQSGGTVAPGNSIGTLTIDGNATFLPGSRLEIEVDPAGTASDLLRVTGEARLAGEVVHVGGDGAYRPEATYTILTADGGVVGTFDSARSNFAFISPNLLYDSNTVLLRLTRNEVPFPQVALTPNQAGAGRATEQLGPGNAIYDAVVQLDAPSARQAFDQLSGEAHASGIAALIGNSGNVRRIAERRFQTTFADKRAAMTFPLASYASYGVPAEQEGVQTGRQAPGYAAWGQVFGSWGRSSSDSRTAGLRHEDGGFLVGADAMIGESWSIGAFAGYSRSTFSARDRNSSGSSDNYHLGFHAGTEIGAMRVNVGAAHTWHAIDTRRTVAFPGFAERLTASYASRTAQIFGEAAYRFGTDRSAIEPFAGLAYVHAETNRFRESGGAAALTATRSTTATSFATLGLRAFTQFELGGVQATARGMVGWRRALSGNAPATRMSFAGGSGFSVSGTPVERDTALVEAGLDLAVRGNVTIGLTYDGQYSRRAQAHGLNARIRVAF